MQTNIFPAVRLAVAAIAVLSGAAVLNGLTYPIQLLVSLTRGS